MKEDRILSQFSMNFPTMKTILLRRKLKFVTLLIAAFFCFCYNQAVNQVAFNVLQLYPHYPQETEIFTDNLMWQVLEVPEGHRFLYLLRAYKDLRYNKSVVITSIGSNYILQPKNLFCQYWFEGSAEPLIKETSKILKLYKYGKWGVWGW
jgi:hypothetical protein